MKKLSFIICAFTLLAGSVIAQVPTKAKLIGKWKATAIETKGKTVSLVSEASVMRAFMPTTGEMKHDDSVMFKQLGKMIYGMLGDFYLDFRANDTVYLSIGISMDGKKRTETDTMHYSLAGGKLTMETGPDKKDIVDIQMPDFRTISLLNFSAAQDGKVTMTRQ